jgi:succinate dehydrogenase / fumarate reductase, cytochrome b subunit
MARLKVFSSSIGTKILIGLTGLALVVFLILHLAGNLLVFAGPGPFNTYSHALITNPLVIPAEIGLAALFLVHIYKTVGNWITNRRARPDGYAEKRWAGTPSRKTLASTTMVYSGIVILVFLILHLRTFKFGAYYQVADTGVRDLHRLVLEVFSHPAYVIFYVVAMGLVGLHLGHGISSAMQSLGAEHPRYTKRLLVAGYTFAVVIAAGFASIPLWVFLLGGPS